MCHWFVQKKSDFQSIGIHAVDVISEDILSDELAYGLIECQGKIALSPFRFGLPSFDGKMILNARVETVDEKKMFSQAYRFHKAVFPCSLYHERTSSGLSYSLSSSSLIYLAGFVDKDRFVLLTGEPVPSLPIRLKRMPIMLKQDEIRPYLKGELSKEALVEDKQILLRAILDPSR